MTDTPNNDDMDEPQRLVELERSSVVDTPRHVIHRSEAGVPCDGPIPQHPLHLCPYCDYNLTGLTSRRCPECGEEFTLSEARRRAFDFSAAGRQLQRAFHWEKGILWAGYGLIAFALLWPCIWYDRLIGKLEFHFGIRALFILWLVLSMLCLTVLFKLYYDWRWSRVLPVTALLLAATSLVIAWN